MVSKTLETEVRNSRAYNAILNFAKSATQFLNKLVVEKEERPPFSIETIPVIDETGYHGESYTIKPNYFKLITSHEEALKQLPEYSAAIQIIAEEEIVKKYYEGKITDSAGKKVENPDIRPFIAMSFLISPLIELIEGNGSLRWDTDKFNAIYKRLEGGLYQIVQKYHYFAPLYNFKSKISEIKLNENVVIHKISPEILKEIWRLGGPLGLIPKYKVLHAQYTIEMIHEYSRAEAISDKVPREVFYKIVSALRLFKKGVPGFNILYNKSLTSIETGSGATLSGAAPADFYGPECTLDSTEVKEFVNFFNFFKARLETDLIKDSYKFLDVSIRRFNSSLENLDPENKLIDYVISLEALYLTEIDELSYRLGLRAAVLLGKDNEEQKYIRKFLSEVYRARSKIIHGKSANFIKIYDEQIPIGKAVEKIEDILRESIKRFLILITSHSNHESMITAIEDAVINTELRAKIREETAPDRF